VEKKKTPPAFLEKLFDILEENAWEEMISWTNEGSTFIIKKVTEFSEIVLPRYFKHSIFCLCPHPQPTTPVLTRLRFQKEKPRPRKRRSGNALVGRDGWKGH
jgi:hypothetical protein